MFVLEDLIDKAKVVFKAIVIKCRVLKVSVLEDLIDKSKTNAKIKVLNAEARAPSL